MYINLIKHNCTNSIKVYGFFKQNKQTNIRINTEKKFQSFFFVDQVSFGFLMVNKMTANGRSDFERKVFYFKFNINDSTISLKDPH